MRQRYAALEILVADNHSTDDTWSKVNGIVAGDERVRCIRHGENIGMARNFNACIASAKGEFVLILCSDDALEPGAVEMLAAALLEYPDAVLAASARILTNIALEPQGIVRARIKKQKIDSASLVRECFVHGNRIGEPSSVMFRRALAVRGFNADYSQGLDLEMWFHLLENGPAVLLPDPGCLIRRHNEQTTRENIQSGRIVGDKRRLFRKYAERLRPSLTVVERLIWDARMASSVGRTRANGGAIETGAVTELLCPPLLFRALCPLVEIGWTIRKVIAN